MGLLENLSPENLKKLNTIADKMDDRDKALRERQIINIINRTIDQIRREGITILKSKKSNHIMIAKIKMTGRIWVQDDNSVIFSIGRRVFTQEKFIKFIHNSKAKP